VSTSRFDSLVASVRRGDGAVRRVDYAGALLIAAAVAIGGEAHADGLAAHETPTGLRLTGLINTCDCVYLYEDEAGNQWGELRLAADVLAPDVIDAWKTSTLTDDHPDVFVTPENWSAHARGSLGSDVRAAEDRKGTLADIAVNDATLIAKVKAGKRGLSCGYGCTLVEESGEHNGVAYKFRQTAYVPNHVSVVDEPRGAGCEFIVDGVRSVRPRPREQEPQPNEDNVKTKDAKIMIGEAEVEVPEEVAAMVAELKAKVEEQGAKLAELSAAGDAEAPVVPPVEEPPPVADSKAKQSTDALEVRLAQLEDVNRKLAAENARNADSIGPRVDARVRLTADARKVLGDKISLDGKTDREIKVAVVKEVTPTAAKLLTADAADSTVDVAFAGAMEFHARTADSGAALAALTRGAPVPMNRDGADLNIIYAQSMDSLRMKAPAEARN
jgi:hypothetical protein